MLRVITAQREPPDPTLRMTLQGVPVHKVITVQKEPGSLKLVHRVTTAMQREMLTSQTADFARQVGREIQNCLVYKDTSIQPSHFDVDVFFL